MVELIPRKILFGNPIKTSPKISPDGTRLAYLAPVNNVLNVFVRTIGEENDKPVTDDCDRGIRLYFWAHDNQHMMYLQDVGGNENWRLYGVDLENGEKKDWTPYENIQVQILEHNKHLPDELLIAMNLENPLVHDVYHLNLQNGALTLAAKNPGDVAGWVADTQLKIRGAMVAHSDGGMELLIRESEDNDWMPYIKWEMEDSLNSHPLYFSKDGQFIYMLDSRNANTSRLVKMNLANREVEIIAEDDQYDAGGIMVHPDTYDIQAVSFVRAHNEWLVLDAEIKQDFEAISHINHGDFAVINRDHSDQTWIIGFTVDDGPVPFYAYHRQSKQAVFLFEHQPALADYDLANMKPITIQARDGLTLHGYITYPLDAEGTKLPMVLNVHGGPWHRDTWGYHPEAQWLTNRGYVCLQLNYRGSTGYGKKFLNAGDREWGGKMHDDLIDAVNWAVKYAGIDRNRIAIYGGSYGGYAALVGVTFTPDIFRCAVDMVGPSNLITLIESFPPYWSTMLTNFKKRVGDPETESEFLKSRSPLFKADQIRVPLLIAQGANDPRVTEIESQQIVKILEEKEIPHEYLLFPDEGHGFVKPENRLKFYAQVEQFLAKHLGGRIEK